VSKDHKQRSKSILRGGRQQAAAAFGGSGGARLDPYVIRAGKTKHGPRAWGKREWVQSAIVALLPHPLPKHVNMLELTEKVEKFLLADPNYQYGEINRMTVTRAFQTLHDANR
jgi:hypothetical protein